MHQSRFIFGGDSAEFSLVAKTWSVAHPPGYPFYSLLINVVNRLIPFGTTPWKIATISSLSTVAASYIIFLILRKNNVGKGISLFASLFYMILFPIWEYSEIPEVFALHNLLSIAITYCILLFVDTKRVRYFFITAFLLGLSFSHHQIFVLFIPGWAYLLYKKRGRYRPIIRLHRKALIISACLFALGLAFYLYDPIASSFSPPLNWENPSTLTGFFRLVTRASYGTFKAYHNSSGNILNQLYDLFSLLIFMALDFRIIGIFLIGLGVFAMKKRKNTFFMFIFISALIHVFFLFYSNFVLVVPFTVAMYERFLIPLYMILVFFLAFGIQAASDLVKKISNSYLQNPLLKRLSVYVVPVFMIFYFFIVSLQNYQTIRLTPNMDIFATYAKNLLDTPPKNSIFFVGADNSSFTTQYYYFGEHYRPDLKFVSMNLLPYRYYRDYARKQYPDVFIPEPGDTAESLKEFLQKNKTHGLYFENPYGPSWEPYGLLWKQYDSDAEAASDSAHLITTNNHLWQSIYTIPQLDDRLKKILHLDVVQGTYLSRYLDYSRILFAAYHTDEARQVVTHLLSYIKNDMRTKFILVNLYLYKHDCGGAKKIVSSVPFEESLQNVDILPSLKDYYMMCEPERKNEIKRITEMQTAVKQPISNL